MKEQELWNLYHDEGKRLFFGRLDTDKGQTYRQIQHISPEQQISLINQINHKIATEGYVTITVSSTKELTSAILESITDLSRLKIRIDGGFHYLNGEEKIKYKKEFFDSRITYTGFEALVILRKIEALEARIDRNLPPTEKARQIAEIVSTEYHYSQKFKEERPGSSFLDRYNTVASLRGITSCNNLGEEGLVCAGYSLLYKELCERSELECDYIRGIAIDRFDGTRGVHAWNVVIGTNNEIIPVDVTWQATDNDKSMWFGQSDEFSFTHIADKDEMFRKYDPEIYEEPKNEKIAYIKNAMDQKYGIGSGNCSLMKYLITQDETMITSSGNAREMISQVSNDEITEYFNHIPRTIRTDTLLLVIENILEEQYGPYFSKQQFNYFTQTGDNEFFPKELKIISERWLNRSDIMNYCIKRQKAV